MIECCEVKLSKESKETLEKASHIIESIFRKIDCNRAIDFDQETFDLIDTLIYYGCGILDEDNHIQKYEETF